MFFLSAYTRTELSMKGAMRTMMQVQGQGFENMTNRLLLCPSEWSAAIEVPLHQAELLQRHVRLT